MQTFIIRIHIKIPGNGYFIFGSVFVANKHIDPKIHYVNYVEQDT